MIGQYLSNTNESTTVFILPKILELNKALAEKWCHTVGNCLRWHKKLKICNYELSYLSKDMLDAQPFHEIFFLKVA